INNPGIKIEVYEPNGYAAMESSKRNERAFLADNTYPKNDGELLGMERTPTSTWAWQPLPFACGCFYCIVVSPMSLCLP
ncbi:MAG: hypothetical protein II199_05735, partial [Bacteroidaceae bacterium]|nr:hypothetical protein [Bacteroidaceae bacterium]